MFSQADFYAVFVDTVSIILGAAVLSGCNRARTAAHASDKRLIDSHDVALGALQGALADYTYTWVKPHLVGITALWLELRHTWWAARTPFVARKLWTVGRALREIRDSNNEAAGRQWAVVALDAIQAIEEQTRSF